jgi:hypothetical protein
MKALENAIEVIGGVAIGTVSLLILVVGALVAFGSLGRYMKIKSM